jgi:hypothetical protein
MVGAVTKRQKHCHAKSCFRQERTAELQETEEVRSPENILVEASASNPVSEFQIAFERRDSLLGIALMACYRSHYFVFRERSGIMFRPEDIRLARTSRIGF